MSDEVGAEATEETLKLYIFGGTPEEQAQGSKQLKEDDDLTWDGVTNTIRPPYDPSLWAYLLEQNTRLRSCIHAFAKNTVGFGYEIVPTIEVTEETPQEVIEEIRRETRLLQDFFGNPNDEMTTTTTLEVEKIDEESTGNGYLEVWRNGENVPQGMAHVPAHTIRVRKGGLGFVQIRTGKKVFFKNFGDGRIIDSETGEVLSDDSGQWKDDEKTIPFRQRANEIIHFKVYSPRSSYYGVPRYVSASPAISGNRLAAMRNVNFFDNDAVPRMLITVSGGELTATTMNNLKAFFRKEARGVFNAHRVAVLQAEKKAVSIQKESAVKIEVHPLTVGKTDDASFQKYRDANDKEVREAFGISEIFLGSSDDINRATAIVAQKVTNEQTFEPDRVAKEYRINHTIVKAFGVRHVRFKLIRPKLSDVSEEARGAKHYGEAGAMTFNDLRRKVMGQAYPSELAAYADIPIPLAVEKFKADLARGGGESDVSNALKFLEGLKELRGQVQDLEGVPSEALTLIEQP
jgi:PBSX family phage portal protein